MQLATSFVKSLAFPLNDHEVEEEGRLLAQVTLEIETVEEEKATAVRGFGERLKKLRQRQTEHAHARSSRMKERPVLCSERAEMRRGEVETFRHDTGIVVDSRAMTPDEVEEARQGGLFSDHGSRGPRIAEGKGGLDLAAPAAPAATASEPAPDPDGGEITNPDGVLDGTEGKPKKGKRGKKNADIAPPTPTETLGVAAIVTPAPISGVEVATAEGDVDEDDLEPEGDDGG